MSHRIIVYLVGDIRVDFPSEANVVATLQSWGIGLSDIEMTAHVPTRMVRPPHPSFTGSVSQEVKNDPRYSSGDS